VADRFPGPLVRVRDRMNAVDYQNILGCHMLPFAKDNMPRGAEKTQKFDFFSFVQK
jgi:hypothetical protein